MFISIEATTFKHYDTRSGQGSYIQLVAVCNIVYIRRQDEFFKIKIARGRLIDSFIVSTEEYEKIKLFLLKATKAN